MGEKDNLYAGDIERVEDFVFDEAVVTVFDDMIQRSVPLYREVQHATARLAIDHALPDTTVYDLGCSTGETLGRIAGNMPARLVGVDNSEAMLTRCRANVPDAELVCADILELDFAPCSVVILNYTLQFIPPDRRAELLRRIHAALVPGGIVLVSEKIRQADPELQAVMTELHHDFKRRHGYSDLEIARKREALEHVLVPLTAEQNIALFAESGFARSEIFLRWYTFISLLAIRD